MISTRLAMATMAMLVYCTIVFLYSLNHFDHFANFDHAVGGDLGSPDPKPRHDHNTSEFDVSQMENRLSKLERSVRDVEHDPFPLDRVRIAVDAAIRGIPLDPALLDVHMTIPPKRLTERGTARRLLDLSTEAIEKLKRRMADDNETKDVESRLGKTVALIIPFRDRQHHLAEFKQHLMRFAKHPQNVSHWEVFVVEQFDTHGFNRGWAFNVGLAIASNMFTASPDLQHEDVVPFNCIVVQDVDYLPEEGVDYTDCRVPTQLSSEIDLYSGKVPYLENVGGVVAMRLKHWVRINGFGNNYCGWGGEDDDVFHRLSYTGLLHGDCFPFCTKQDTRIGQKGLSIRRPKFGHGRFKGHRLHLMNHTKRKTNSFDYEQNARELAKTQRDGEHWKTTGLSNLEFRIISHVVGETTEGDLVGIKWHHVKVRRGKTPFRIMDMRLAALGNICRGPSIDKAITIAPFSSLGKLMPWTLNSLRQQVPALLKFSPSRCKVAASINFILVDLRRYIAKVLSDQDPQLWITFLRSMQDPAMDGLIIADGRGAKEIVDAFKQAGAYASPPVEIRICSATTASTNKYSVTTDPSCSGGRSFVHGSSFLAFTSPRPELVPISWCDNSENDVQYVVQGHSCPVEWSGLKWTYGGTIWVPQGDGFCTGTKVLQGEPPQSNVLKQKRCDTDGFVHSFSFGSVAVGRFKWTDRKAPLVINVCRNMERTRLFFRGESCESEIGWKRLSTFVATSFEGKVIPRGVQVFCGVPSDNQSFGDTISTNCAKRVTPVFAVEAKDAALHESVQICAGRHSKLGVGEAECVGATVSFVATSLHAVVASTPPTSMARGPLYVVVEEDKPCESFVCPTTLNGKQY